MADRCSLPYVPAETESTEKIISFFFIQKNGRKKSTDDFKWKPI